ncbi:Sporulation kinase D [Planctopirus ephydatiae]|uniref:histidine kinase n=1 Tax=Planctopirus ephydatiae TaxID=2528019 RepID=A0A518GS03_9PLAN|nr:ATP-binding protein [Planctopirus ephydatiae]QDV31372.1 Sporulation kinase D [Planctopirus ephydatiae]
MNDEDQPTLPIDTATSSNASLSENSWSPDASRLEALAEFAAGAGHEINNPLATILGRVQLLLPGESHPDRRKHLETIMSQTLRIRDMIGDLMLFARPPAPQRAMVDLKQLVEEVCRKQKSEIQLAGCELEFSCETCQTTAHQPIEPVRFEASVDRHQWAIVVAELLRNARQAMKENGGVVSVRLLRIAEATPRIALTITDPGRGFSAIDQQHAFDPFYSGREAGRGIGFGLCKVWQIVRQHEGTIVIQSQPQGPTTVTVTVPALQTTES